MFMQYLGGGIGHKVSHQASPAIPSEELVNDSVDREESDDDWEEIGDDPQPGGVAVEEEEELIVHGEEEEEEEEDNEDEKYDYGVEVPNASFTALPLFFYFIRTSTFTILFVWFLFLLYFLGPRQNSWTVSFSIHIRASTIEKFMHSGDLSQMPSRNDVIAGGLFDQQVTFLDLKDSGLRLHFSRLIFIYCLFHFICFTYIVFPAKLTLFPKAGW